MVIFVLALMALVPYVAAAVQSRSAMSSTPPQAGPWGHADDDDNYPAWDVRSDYDDTDGSWDAPGAPPNVNLVVGKECAPTGTGTEREAVVEALEQLRDPDNTQGVVWIPDYQERFSGLGMTLRELLESHPDKFTVHHDAWPVSLVYREDTFHVDHVSLVYREVHSNSNSSWCTISMAPSRPGKVGSLVDKEHAPTGTGTEREAHYPTAYAMRHIMLEARLPFRIAV